MALKVPLPVVMAAFAGWCLLLSSISEVSAADLHVSAGLKGGWTYWGMKLGGDRISSGFQLIGGPEIGLNKGPVFAGLEVASGRFAFGNQLLCSGGACQEAKNGSADLLYLQTGIGYYVKPWLGPYIGYLYQKQTLRFTLSVGGKSKTDQSLGVLVLGVLLNHSWLGQRAAIYGNVAALGLESGNGLGGLGEAGFSYAARFLPFGFTVAVRYQIFHFENPELVLNGQSRKRDEMIGILAEFHFTK